MLRQENLKGLFHFELFNQKNGLWILELMSIVNFKYV